MTGHANMNDFSALQFDDEESKERTEDDIRHRQEVTRPDLARMIVQERRPRLRGGSYAPLSHVFLYGAFGDLNAQLEQLPADTLGSPQAIVTRHRFDQRNGLGSNFGSRRGRLGASPPVPAERLTVPAEEGVGLDNQERLFPVLGDPCE